MKKSPTICVVVPVRNRKELTLRFLKAFVKSDYKNYKLVLVDDASTDGSPEEIKKMFPQVELIEGDGNLWWTGATNLGVKYAIEHDFDYVLTINNDAQVDSKYLSNILRCALDNPDSIIGSLILRDDNKKIWSIGGHLNWKSHQLFNLNFAEQDTEILKTLKNPYETEILNGNGTLIPTKIFKKIGLYNYYFTPHYHADSEIIVRAKKHGFKSYVCLNAVLLNHISTEPNVIGRKNLLFNYKSDYFWRALLFFYLAYGPKRYFFNYFAQYFKFFHDIPAFHKLSIIKQKVFNKDRK